MSRSVNTLSILVSIALIASGVAVGGFIALNTRVKGISKRVVRIENRLFIEPEEKA